MLEQNRTAILHGGYIFKNLYSLWSIRNESNSPKLCGVLPRTNLMFCAERKIVTEKDLEKRGNRDNNIVESQNVSCILFI